MKLFISHIDTPAIPAESQKQITNYISPAVKEAIESGFEKKNIIIVSDENNIYRDACIARSHQVKLQLGETKVSLGSTPLAKSLFILTLASRNKDIFREKARAFKECKKALTKMTMESLELVIKEKLSDSNELFISELKTDIAKGKAEVIKSISISPDNKKVKFVDADYKDDLNHLVTTPGIHLFTGERGTGKSELLMRLFKEAHIDRRYPIYMSASRVLTEELIGDDILNYKYAYADSFARGALGVMLKLLLDDNYHDLRHDSESLFMDELEDLRDLSTSEIVGNGTLEDKKLLLQRWEEQIIKSTSAFGADAFVNDDTVDWLYKLAEKSGKTIYVYNQKSQFKKPLIRVMPYATNLELSRRSIINGEKSGIFSDNQHNKVKSKFEANIIAINGKKKEIQEDEQEYIADYAQIDAAFMHSEKSKEIGDISKLASAVQVVFYNTAAKNGLSILDTDYKRVSVLGHGTSAPNDFVQADGRLRLREQVWLSFDKPERRLCTNPVSILVNMINKEFSDTLTADMLNDMLSDPHLQCIASRIAFKNKMRENYEFTVLSIYGYLSHEIEFFDDKEARDKGNRNRKASTTEEKATRDKKIITADKITEIEAKNIVVMGKHANNNNKHKLRNYELRNFYRVAEVTQELLDFDNDGKGALILENLMLAEDTAKTLTIDGQFKKRLIQRFISTVQLHDEKFRYNNTDAIEFHDFLFNNEIKVGIQSRKAIDVFYEIFEQAKASSALPTITSVLKNELCIEPIQKGKKDKQRAYIANLSSDTKMWLEHIQNSRFTSKVLLVA